MPLAPQRVRRGFDRFDGAAAFESLEDRRVLSAVLVHPIPASLPMLTSSTSILPISPTPIVQGGVTIDEKAGVPFTAVIGTFSTIAPGTNLHATVSWGDGTVFSQGVITPTGIGGLDVVNYSVTGSHTYADGGTFPITIYVTQSFGPPGSLSPIRLVTVIKSTAVVSPSANLNLNGIISGTYSVAPSAFTVGAVYVFNGTGFAGAMGPVQASGKVALPPPIATTAIGQAKGTITLSSIGASPLPGGTVTLAVTGPAQAAFGPFPTLLHYTITSGTGAFSDATGTGTIAVILDPTSQKFTFMIHSD